MGANDMKAHTKQLAGQGLRSVPIYRIAMLVLAIAASASAQKVPDRGFMPARSYALGDLETINTTSGNLMLNIPLAQLPPGRAGLSASLSLAYNSRLWDSYPDQFFALDGSLVTVDRLFASPQGGWRYAFQYKLQLIPNLSATNTLPCSSPDYKYQFKLIMSFPDGSTHEFRPLGFTEGLP